VTVQLSKKLCPTKTFYQIKRRHIPVNINLQTHHLENIKSHEVLVYLLEVNRFLRCRRPGRWRCVPAQCFGGTQCLQLQVQAFQKEVAWHIQKKADGSFETSGTTQPTTQRHILQDL